MSRRKDHTEQLDRAIVLMAQRVDTYVTIPALARAAGMSPYHFIRIFHRTKGITPLRYYTLLKMQEARRLILQTPDLPLGYVPGMLGLESVGTFSSSFSRWWGIPPSWLRRPRCLCLAVSSDLHSGADHTTCAWWKAPCMECHTCRSIAVVQVTV